jgi:hypothetical protein
VNIVFFSLTAALNPTLLGATTVMLLLPRPKRLLVGYLLGALVTSITLGLIIVFKLENSSAVDSAQNTFSPAFDFALGALALLIAYLLRTDRDQQLKERREERRERKHKTKKEKGTPRWQRFLAGGSAKSAFVVGAILTLPGGSYLAGLDSIAKQDWAVAGTVAAVLFFNVVMMSLLELPLLSYALAPEQTPHRIERLKTWLSANGRRLGIRVATGIGVLLIVRAVIEVLA